MAKAILFATQSRREIEGSEKQMTSFKCEHCGMVNGKREAAIPRRGKAGGRPPLDRESVRTAEKMLGELKEPSDIARQLHCSERTIRRVLAGDHKYSNSRKREI